MKVKRCKSGEGLCLPEKAKKSDSGFDLRAALPEGDVVVINPGEIIAIPTGFAWEIPEHWYGRISPRSGLAVDHGIDILGGIIDAGYRGEVKCIMINHGSEPFTICRGDRIAQMIISQIHPLDTVELVDHLGETSRGNNGFGSTGKR